MYCEFCSGYPNCLEHLWLHTPGELDDQALLTAKV